MSDSGGVFHALSRSQKTVLFFAGCVPLRFALAVAAFFAPRNLVLGFSAAMLIGIVFQIIRSPNVWWNRQLWALLVLFIFMCALFVQNTLLLSILVTATMTLHVILGIIAFIEHYY